MPDNAIQQFKEAQEAKTLLYQATKASSLEGKLSSMALAAESSRISGFKLSNVLQLSQIVQSLEGEFFKVASVFENLLAVVDIVAERGQHGSVQLTTLLTLKCGADALKEVEQF